MVLSDRNRAMLRPEMKLKAKNVRSYSWYVTPRTEALRQQNLLSGRACAMLSPQMKL